MNTPNDMIAIAISNPGGPEVLHARREPVPVPGAGEVLIRVGAAGVNGPDIAQRRGQYAPPPGASPLPGLEVAGEIAALGEGVLEFETGQAVMALCNGGGYAEYVVVPAGQVLPAPNGWTLAEAAALPETWFTVTQTLVMRAGLEAGMTVLIHGASGGIGGAAIQIAGIVGAKPIAVVSDDAKADYCRALGAIAVINRKSEDLVARVKDLTDGKGVDRVVDIVGGDMARTNVEVSARGGHIVQISTLEGGNADVPLRQMMAKDLTLSGSTLRPQTSATKAAIAQRIRTDFLPALSTPGFIKPRVTPFPLAQASDAHRLMESRNHQGKLVLLTEFGAEDKTS